MKNNIIKCLSLVLAMFCISFIFTGCEVIKDHKITVTSWDISTGTVSGYGTYKTNYEVTITATPKSEQNRFLAWIKDGYIVSQENPYTFTASDDTQGKYIAIFNSEYLDLLQLTLACVTIPGMPIDDGTSETTVTNITNLSFEIGTSSDTLVSLATKGATVPTPPLTFTNEFTIQPYVINKETEYYITFSMTIEYTDRLSGEITTRRYPTQIRINFSNLGTTQNGNLTTEQDSTTGNYIITRKNLTADTSWTVTEDASPTFVLTFSSLSFEQPEVDDSENI